MSEPGTLTFDDLPLPEDFQDVIRTLGFTTPTPIQAQALPHTLKGHDVIGKAETGTGKTLAFGLQMLLKVDVERSSVQGLVICPTRELALQVLENLVPFAQKRGIRVGLAIGGEGVKEQLRQLRGCQVVVGTPGRLIEINRDHQFSFGWVECLALDEFDRMLDMGFIDDVTHILSMTPPERQTLLFSATFPPATRKITQRFMRSPVTVETATGTKTAATIRQTALRVTRQNKFRNLLQILDNSAPEDTFIVFCNSKRDVRFLDRELWGRGYSAASLSSDHEQDVRFQVLDAFKRREFRTIVATDVASRGLDIPHVAHVVNYNVPMDVEDYVHRIGRTGRAGRTGLVTTLVADEDYRYFLKIVNSLGIEAIEGASDFMGGAAPRGGSREGGREAEGGEPHHRGSEFGGQRRRGRRGGGGGGRGRSGGGR